MTRRLVALVLVVVVAIAAGVGLWHRVGGGADGQLWGDVASGPARVALPAPRAVTDGPDPTPADYAGAATCAECHAEQHAAWTGSTHGRAGGAPEPRRVIAPFDGTPIRFRDAVVIPRADGGRYTFTVRRENEADLTVSVDGVVGGGHMRGGGTQGFVTRWRDGTLRFLSFDYSRQSATWFCNTDSRAGHGWVPITPDLPLAACGDWPPTRVLGDEPRFTNCQGCHASQVRVRLDTTAHAWQTSFASLAIDCESCHGPARAHVDAARAGRPASGSATMRALATLDRDRSTEVCLQCHAVKARLVGTGTHVRYSTRLALLGDSLLYPDGRTHTFAYQEGQLWSDCAVNGGMRCTSCHDPHTQRYRDATGAPLARWDDDGQCTSCHAAIGARGAAHTGHAATSAGSRCVACHMPYLQQPAVGTAIRYGRSDHTIAIPRPALDAAAGVPNACAGCHADRPTARLEADVTRLWGTLKPRAAPIEALAATTDTADPASAARLLDTVTTHVAAQYAALARYAERFVTPDMPSLDRDALARLRALAGARDVDVRALALATLHYAGGERSGVRRFLAERLADSASDAALRARWTTALGALADGRLARGDAPGAIQTLRKALEIQPREPRVLLNLGLAYAAAGDAAHAADAYRDALAADPVQPLALVNLGIAHEALSDTASAIVAYQRALTLDAYEPLALANLGNVALRRGQPDAAIPYYERALAVDPSLASVHFALAQAVGQRGDLPRALAELRRGLAYDSSDAQVQALARTLAERLAAAGPRR